MNLCVRHVWNHRRCDPLMLRGRDVMYYGSSRRFKVILTWDYLKHAVLLHVGREVSGPHVLLHYANVGQLLTRERPGKKNFIGTQAGK